MTTIRMQNSKYLMVTVLLLAVAACKSNGNNEEKTVLQDIKEYVRVISTKISPVEFNMADVQDVMDGKSKADRQVNDSDYMMMQFGNFEDTRSLEARAWQMDDGKAMVALNFFQYEEIPKIKFFVVDNTDMSVQEVKSPINIDFPDDIFLFYALKDDTSNIEFWTYQMEDSNGNPMRWTAKWNGTSFDAQASNSEDTTKSAVSIFGKFDGVYQQINDQMQAQLFSLNMEGDKASIFVNSFFDIAFEGMGSPENVSITDNSIYFDIVLEEKEGDKHNAKLLMTDLGNGLYEVIINGSNDIELIRGKHTVFKCNADGSFTGALPATLNVEKHTIKDMLKSIGIYYHQPEIISTLNHLFAGAPLEEYEQVVDDEKNRYLSYAWGSQNINMECKYWKRDDGKYLLVMDRHDSTYEFPQDLRFYLLDYEKNTVEQLHGVPFAEQWGVGADAEGKVYQVRYNTNDIVALVPESNGEGIDIVNLRFDGLIFK